MSNNIKVVCRFRPMNRMEVEARSDECVEYLGDTGVAMKNAASLAGPEKDGFHFDRVFDTDSQQEDIFDWGVKGIVEDVMTGFNGTLFCYGQTGSGKTYTMMGADIDNPALKGLIPRIVEQIFASIMSADSSIEYTVKVSYMEIYMEKIKDLLQPANDNLSIHEDKARGVYVKGLTDVYVGSEGDVYKVMRAGANSRAVSSTNMNAESSRSHSIFVIGIHQRNVETGSQKSGNLFLVDLAGSEKVGKTGATGQTLEEAKKINKSLSALGMVINSLTDGKSTHVPYRDSKLTRILQESLGGNSRTTLIVNCSPASYNEAETLSTLRFGMRAKSIKNKARVNVEMSPAELKALLKKTQAELANYRAHAGRLEDELASWRNGVKVEKDAWAPSMAEGASAGAAPPKRPMGTGTPSALPAGLSTPGSKLGTPMGTPAGLLSPALLDSRPETPSGFSLPADEKEEFLRRENELSDQLAEKESALAASEKVIGDLRDEITYLKEQDESVTKENHSMSAELNSLRILTGRLESESKDASINLDQYKDKVSDLQRDIEEQKIQLEKLQKVEKREKEEEKERRKEAMLGEMMAKIDLASHLQLLSTPCHAKQSGGTSLDAASEKLRSLLATIDKQTDEKRLGEDTKDLIKSHLAEHQDALREMQERLRMSSEDMEMNRVRRQELEVLLEKREGAYEDLLDKTANSQNVAIAEIKEQIEARYKAQEDLLRSDISNLTEQAESRVMDIRRLQTNVETLKLSNEELNRALTLASNGTPESESFATATKDAERIRKQMQTQHAEFEISKKSLVKDLQNRCEKVVELEMQLDEIREQYKLIARSTNSKAQARKLEFLQHNLEQLNVVQKQLVEQNTSLKKEVGVAEKRLMARNDRIQNLEQALTNADQRNAQKDKKYEATVQLLQNRLMETQQNAQKQGFSLGRIAKPLRGGGGGQYETPNYQVGGQVGKLQSEEGTKRQSWFFN